MTVRIQPPLAYRRADGTRGEIDDPGGWHYPVFDWSWYGNPVSGWVHMGWAPRPRTRWQKAKRHLFHGLLMGYPLRDVLAWVWRVDIRGGS